jgi:hypothetical protein
VRLSVQADDDPDAVWEACEACGRWYRYPHLCRAHRLCGLCHPPIPAEVPSGRDA